MSPSRWTLLSLLLAACAGSSDPGTLPDESDTPVDDSDDTDVYETGWDDTETDTDATPTDDTGDGRVPDDTALCPFAERPDCDGTCYPLYFVGDGTCDDGSTFGSNFDCQDWDFDGGDCTDDTDPVLDDTATDECPWLVHIDTSIFATEVAWQIREPGGRVLYDILPGSYTVARRFEHQVRLPTGRYFFVMLDAMGDGWNGGTFTLIDPRTGVTVDSGTLPFGRMRAESRFDVVCEQPQPVCGDLQLDLRTSTSAGQIGWSIVDEHGASLVSAGAGSFQNNQTYRFRASFPAGNYVFRMTDTAGDGWGGAWATLVDRFTGLTLIDGALPTGATGDLPFRVDCAGGAQPELPPPTCDPIQLVVHTQRDGMDVGWELRPANGAAVLSASAGTYGNNANVVVNTPIGTGDWVLRLLDRAGDGWEGAWIDVYDPGSGRVLGSYGRSFAWGSEEVANFSLTCPEDPPPEEETGLCASNTVVDCDGVCWPESYLGDGFCDDGVGFAPDLACEALGWDGGDCLVP